MYMASPRVTLSASGRLWVRGLEGFGATLEFGATQRVLAHSTAGFTTSIGTGVRMHFAAWGRRDTWQPLCMWKRAHACWRA